MDIFGDRGKEAWSTPPISDRRFDDEGEISPELADFLNSPEFYKGFRELRNGQAVEPEPSDVNTSEVQE